MTSHVFFSQPGKGYFEALLPSNVKKMSHDSICQWAYEQSLSLGYKDYLVSENPRPYGINL